jgi:hypothetical protein
MKRGVLLVFVCFTLAYVFLLPLYRRSEIEIGNVKAESDTFEKYVELHESIMNGTSTQKFLIFSSPGGLGNQLYGAVSALWYSIVTNRALVGKNCGSIMCNFRIWSSNHEYEFILRSSIEYMDHKCSTQQLHSNKGS